MDNKTLTYTFANATVSGEAKTNYIVTYSFAPTYKYKQTNRSPDSPTTLVEITPEFEEKYMVVKFLLNDVEIPNESILVDKGTSLQGVGGDRGWNSSTSTLVLSYTISTTASKVGFFAPLSIFDINVSSHPAASANCL